MLDNETSLLGNVTVPSAAASVAKATVAVKWIQAHVSLAKEK